MQGGGAWPEALARARLGDASAAPELVPLLAAARADVRAAAARALGELGANGARNVLSTLRERDADAGVRAEAAIAALRLGDEEAARRSPRCFRPARRARRSRAPRGAGAGTRTATRAEQTCCSRPHAAPRWRSRCGSPRFRALAQVGSERASSGPVAVARRSAAAQRSRRRARRDQGSRAVAPLRDAFEQERYAEARRAESAPARARRARARARRCTAVSRNRQRRARRRRFAARGRAGGARARRWRRVASCSLPAPRRLAMRSARLSSARRRDAGISAQRAGQQRAMRAAHASRGHLAKLEVNAQVHYLNAGPTSSASRSSTRDVPRSRSRPMKACGSMRSPPCLRAKTCLRRRRSHGRLP